MGSKLSLFKKPHEMEAILGPDSEPFEAFLSGHGWSSEKKDSEKESEAESMFNMMKQKDPDSLAIKLSNFLRPPHNLHIREKCADLLRKLLTDDANLCTWNNLSLSTQSTIKSILPDRVEHEESRFIIQELLITVYSLLPNNSWPELLPSLYQFVTNSSSDISSKYVVFVIFANLDVDTTVPCVKLDFHSLFRNTLNDDTLDIHVKMAAVRAVICKMMGMLSEKEQFQTDLLPGMMRTLTEALTISEAAKHVPECVVRLKKLLIDDEKVLEERVRQLVVEFLTQFQKAQMEAILEPNSSVPFESFISYHLSSSEETKLEANSIFNVMKKYNPDSLAIKLSNFLSPTHDLYIRQKCVDLFHKLLTDDDDLCTWHNLSASTQSTIKCFLLDHIEQEESAFIVDKLIKIIWKLVSLHPDNTSWPNLLPSLYRLCITNCSSSNFLKEAVLLIFGDLAEHIGETTDPCAKDLHSLFLNTLNDDNIHVRTVTMRAVIKMMRTLTEKKRFQDLFPSIRRTLTDTLTIGEAAKRVLDCAELLHNFLNDDEKVLEERTRQLAVEFLTEVQKAQMEAILESLSNVPFESFISYRLQSSELLFNMMKHKYPESLAIKLVDYLSRPSHKIYTRQECAKLLHKLLNDDDLCTWHSLSVSTQSTIKCIILDSIKLEESAFILGELLEIVLKLVDSLHDPDNTWPELLPSLYQCVTSSGSSQYLKGLSFLVFERIAYDDIGETTVPYCVKDLQSLFFNTLNDDTLHVRVRMTSTIAVITFIQRISSSSNKKERFQDLLPGMMRTLTDALSNRDYEDEAREVLSFFIELAKNEPRFLRRQLVDVVATMFDIAEDEGLEEGTRHLAIEFLITLVDARERAPGMMKRLPSFISRCFIMLLNLLLDIKDDTAWHIADTLLYAGSATLSNNYRVGTQWLRRFSVALGGKSIAHTAKELLCTYLASPKWEKRHAALYALGLIAKGCSKVMIKNLEELLVMILNCFQDSHPRVRWAACMAICQLLTDFSPHLQEEYHNQVLLALAAAMDDFHPQVQAFAAGVLSDFFQSGKPEMFIPYLDGIVNKLLVLLQTGKQMVQKEALNALSHIALCVEEHFRTYYDTVIPHLKAVLRDADLKSNLHFRARAMYCISHVGFAVGKEKFREDTEQVMEVLIISFQGLQMKEDEPSTEFLLKACTRICNCLGQDFLPYMSAVIPFIMQFAQPFTELDYENNGLDDKIMKRLLEDKATACITLSNCAAELKEDFYSWIPEVVSVLLPLLKFYSHNNIRKYAVGAMYPLLHSAKLAVEKGIAQRESESYFKELSDYIILSLLEALHEEPMTKICAFMLGELNNCLQISPPLLIEGQLRRIVDEVKHVITESSSRKRKLKERAKSEDFDAEEDELLGEEKELETEIFVQVGTVVCTLIEIFKAGFLPFFDELSPYLITMWGEDKTVQERCTSVYLIDHLVMKCPEAALKYSDVFLPLLLDTSNDEIPKVRQNALYGLALYAVYGGSVFKPFISEAISRINVVITHLRARERENESVYYTAVFALSKICQFHLESIDSSAQVVLIWLNSLPVKGDLDKADYVHGLLCLMVQWLHGEHIDPNYHYLPKIISVFAEVICSEEDLATEETANCMINTLRYLQLTLPPATLESAWSYLLPQQEMKLKYILSPEEDAKLLTNSMKSLLL